MRTILLAVFLLHSYTCYTQNGTGNEAVIDSILNVVSKISSAEDKVVLLSQFTSKLRYGDGSIRLIKKSEEISKKSKISKLLATTYYYYGNYYYFNSKLDSSLYYIEKSKALIKDEELPFLRSSVLNTEGGVYLMKGNMPKGLATTLKSLAFLDKVDTTKLSSEEKIRYKKENLALDNSLANYYNQMGEYEKASEFYDKGYTAAMHDKSYIAAGVFITNKGDLFLNTEKYPEALTAFLEGKQLKEKGNAPKLLIINSDLNIGIAHTNLNNFEEALPYLNDAASFYESANMTMKLAETLVYRGDLFLKQQQYDLAGTDCGQK